MAMASSALARQRARRLEFWLAISSSASRRGLMLKRLPAALVLAVAAASGAEAQVTHAFTNARIIPISGPVIEKGTLVVRDGKIVSVGSGGAPAGAETHDLAGKTLMPGLVDTHSHIASPAGADSSAPIQPDVRVLDSVNVQSSGIRRAQAGGITTVNIMPGSGHLLSGQTLYLKLRRHDHRRLDDRARRRPYRGRVEDGQRHKLHPHARRAVPRHARQVGVARARAVRQGAGVPEPSFARPATMRARCRRAISGMEALVEVLDGTRTVHFHTHRHDDIVTVLRLAQEFGFKPVLQHVSEGWKVADEIARAGVPASIIMIDAPGGKLETVDVAFKTGGVLEKAGVNVGFHTDDYITDSRLFLRSAGVAVRAGMSARQGALRHDDGRRADAGARQPHRHARGRQGRGLHRPFGRSAERVHARGADVGRRGRKCSTEPTPPTARSRQAATACCATRRCTSMVKERISDACSAECRACRCSLGVGGCRVLGAVLRAGLARRSLGVGGCLVLAAAPAFAQVAVRGETVYTMAGAPIKDGIVLVGKDGKIERVGPASGVNVPSGYRTLQREGGDAGAGRRALGRRARRVSESAARPDAARHLRGRSSRNCAPPTPTTRARHWWSGFASTV